MLANKENVQFYFFLTLFAVVGILLIFIFLPLLNSIAIAFVLAVVFKPVYRRLKKLITWSWLAAGLTIVLIGILVILPIALVTNQVVQEARTLTVNVIQSGPDHPIYQVADFVESEIQRWWPQFAFQIETADWLDRLLDWVMAGVRGNWSLIGKGTVTLIHAVISIIFAVVILFFLFKDGANFKSQLIKHSPLSDDLDRQIMSRLEQTVNSVIRGALVVAVIQGVLTGVGLAIFGVPSATLWGLLAAILALVPGLGPVLVIVPATAYLYFLEGQVLAALGLAIWGVVVVGLVDNVLIPYFYSRGIKIHPILIMLSVFGGLAAFGPLGTIFGPLVLSLFLTLLDMYRYFIDEKAV